MFVFLLHPSRSVFCQAFSSIFVCLAPGGGVVNSSLECLLWVTYVDLPILHSLAPVAMATRAVNADTSREGLKNIHGNGHTRVNPVCMCVSKAHPLKWYMTGLILCECAHWCESLCVCVCVSVRRVLGKGLKGSNTACLSLSRRKADLISNQPPEHGDTHMNRHKHTHINT